MTCQIISFSPKLILPLLFFLAISSCQEKPAGIADPATTLSTAAGPTVTSKPDPTQLPAPTDPATPTIAPTSTQAPTSTPLPLPDLSFTVQTTSEIAASGELVDLGQGIAVQLPPDALEAGASLELSQLEIDPSWRQALEDAYTIDTPFISLAVAGQSDGQGRALLRLPAASSESRLVAVIDNRYLAMIDAPPLDGFLQAPLRVGPGDSAGLQQVGSLVAHGSLQYTVLTPKQAAAAVKYRLGKRSAQDPGFDPHDCGVEVSRNREVGFEVCRQNLEQTVQVNYLSSLGVSEAEAEQLADDIASAMARYLQLGFVSARLNSDAPVYVVVQTAAGDPQYSYKNSTLYIPAETLKASLAGQPHDLLHELAHWIQDEEYIMALAAVSGSRSWWLETAAENMVMLYDQRYIPMNLIAYGNVSADDQRLTLQQAPYQWPGNPGNLYVHAQLVKLNMCGDTAVCPLSETTFIAAINQGSYPYAAGDAQSMLSGNLNAYAKYLLGANFGRANTAMPREEPVLSGGSYGENIQVAQTNKSEYNLTFNGVEPQMKAVETDAGTEVKVSATLDKDGVYPLKVSSGINGRFPGLPVALTIQPGAPFWYRVGQDAPQFHDGTQELVLAPIHLEMGLPGVRLVAMGKKGGETFQATVRPIDLQGVWVFSPGTVVSDNISCDTSSDAVESQVDEEALLMIPTLGSVMGDFRPDAAGNGLTWDWNYDRLPGEARSAAGSMWLFEGAVLPGPTDVKLQAQFEWVAESSQLPTQSPWPSLLLGAVAVVPGAWGLRQGRKRPYMSLIGLLLVTVLLVGCFGLSLDIQGTVGSNMQFTTIEYLGGESVPVLGVGTVPDVVPLWKLQGTADYDLDFTVLVNVSEGEDESTNIVNLCRGKATYQVEAMIFKDVVLNLE